MEQQLTLALQLVKSNVTVRYVSRDTPDIPVREGEIVVDKSKIDTCPSEHMFISSIQKKINRSDMFKSQKNTLGICVLIILSNGYSVTSATINEVENSFIERCWECIQVVSHNTPENLSSWIQECMSSRSPLSYSMIYCQQRPQQAPIRYLGKSIRGSGPLTSMMSRGMDMPENMWHRDDAVYWTMMLHTMSRHREFSDDTERS